MWVRLGMLRCAARTPKHAACALFACACPPPAVGELQDALAAERELLLEAHKRGVTYLVGHSNLRAEPGSRWIKVRVQAGVFWLPGCLPVLRTLHDSERRLRPAACCPSADICAGVCLRFHGELGL